VDFGRSKNEFLEVAGIFSALLAMLTDNAVANNDSSQTSQTTKFPTPYRLASNICKIMTSN
jgi:hypothetical protein